MMHPMWPPAYKHLSTSLWSQGLVVCLGHLVLTEAVLIYRDLAALPGASELLA